MPLRTKPKFTLGFSGTKDRRKREKRKPVGIKTDVWTLRGKKRPRSPQLAARHHVRRSLLEWSCQRHVSFHITDMRQRSLCGSAVVWGVQSDNDREQRHSRKHHTCLTSTLRSCHFLSQGADGRFPNQGREICTPAGEELLSVILRQHKQWSLTAVSSHKPHSSGTDWPLGSAAKNLFNFTSNISSF